MTNISKSIDPKVKGLLDIVFNVIESVESVKCQMTCGDITRALNNKSGLTVMIDSNLDSIILNVPRQSIGYLNYNNLNISWGEHSYCISDYTDDEITSDMLKTIRIGLRHITSDLIYACSTGQAA